MGRRNFSGLKLSSCCRSCPRQGNTSLSAEICHRRLAATLTRSPSFSMALMTLRTLPAP